MVTTETGAPDFKACQCCPTESFPVPSFDLKVFGCKWPYPNMIDTCLLHDFWLRKRDLRDTVNAKFGSEPVDNSALAVRMSSLGSGYPENFTQRLPCM